MTDGFATRAIHAGQDPDPTTGSVITPIHATSTYVQDGVGNQRAGYEYSRTGNPTRSALEECLASLEGGRFGRAFASGMSATDAVLRATLRPGDHLIIPDDAYGGTFRLIDKVLTGWGVDYTPARVSEVDEVRAAIRPNTKVIWVESPTNPLLNIADLAALAQLAHDTSTRLVVDNTFASPYLQQPLEHGASVVVHSTTKYLGGHSDVVGGAMITSDEEVAGQVAFLQNTAGAVPGPFDAWLTLRGLKTLALRMERHSRNAENLVTALHKHPKVDRIYYPGLPDHPGHEVASKQMRHFGGMLSFTHVDGEQAAIDVCSRTRLFTLAESLGGVESLIEHPGRMTHASTAGSLLQVPAELVRVSAGVEESEDLVADLLAALE